jgi:tripartite-type tricarboxylate transporter receptor subunit TctC
MKLQKLFALGALLLAAGTAIAQPAYPSRVIRLVVPYSSGSSDVVARMIAPRLNEAWKQPVIVDNRPGANAVIGTDHVAKAAPDGYTLLLALGTHVISPLLIATPYDPVKDFAPVATIGAAELGLAIHPGVPANNLQEFIALAKSKPGELNYSTTQIGGNQHLAGELFSLLTGAKLTAVPFKGGGEALNAVMGGHVQAYFGSVASVIPVVKGGKVKGIAVSGNSRNRELPQVPTFAQGGVAGFDVKLWYGLLAPAGTPKEIVDKLSAQITAILATPELKDTLAKNSIDPIVSTPEQFAAMMRADIARYTRVIKTANIKVEQ